MRPDVLARHSWLIRLPFLLITGMLWAGLLAGCSPKSTSESPGDYMDDPSITARVQAALINNASIHAADIHVETYKGVVQLSGSVASQDEVRSAADTTASVPGVVSVKNDLTVK